MKKLILFFLIILLSIVEFKTFDNSTSHKFVSEDTSKDTELLIWIQESFSGSETYFSELTSKFEKFYPHVNITYEIIKGTDLRTYKYMTDRLINGITPDLLLLSVSNFNAFATQYMLMNLSDHVTANDRLLPSTLNNGIYEGKPYGIAYYLDPEMLVYNIHHLQETNINIPTGFSTSEELMTYMTQLNNKYARNHSETYAFSIPSLISEGQFFRSLLQSNQWDEVDTTLFEQLRSLYLNQNSTPYYYGKDSHHPFFEDAATFSLEPLSLVYEQIDSNYNMHNSIGIVPMESSGVKFSYSKSHYITIFSETKQPSISKAFLELFLSDTEILNRYKYYNVPIISYALEDVFTNDASYNNTNIWNYLESAFHFPISPDASNINDAFDTYYNTNLNQYSGIPQGEIP